MPGIAHPACTAAEVVRLHRQIRAIVVKTADRRLSWKQVARLSKDEGWFLRLLNSHLIGLRYEAGQVVEVERHLYKVSTNGSLAIHVGEYLCEDAPGGERSVYEAATTVSPN